MINIDNQHSLTKKIKPYAIVLLSIGILFAGQHLVQAADSSNKGGGIVVASSSATNNVTDLWVVDQSSKMVYLCRASGGSGSAPTCTKGTQLP